MDQLIISKDTHNPPSVCIFTWMYITSVLRRIKWNPLCAILLKINIVILKPRITPAKMCITLRILSKFRFTYDFSHVILILGGRKSVIRFW